jgi:hypothetical protein
MATTPVPSTVSSSTLNHNPLPSSPVYIHKTTDINKNKIIVTAPQDSNKSKSKDPSLPYYDPDFPDKPANMPFCSQPKANANHKVCYDESDNPHPPCTKYPDNPACGTGKNVAGQGQPVKSCNTSQDSACITSITSTLQPENLNPSAIGGGQLSPQIQNNPPSPQQSSDELLDKASDFWTKWGGGVTALACMPHVVAPIACTGAKLLSAGNMWYQFGKNPSIENALDIGCNSFTHGLAGKFCKVKDYLPQYITNQPLSLAPPANKLPLQPTSPPVDEPSSIPGIIAAAPTTQSPVDCTAVPSDPSCTQTGNSIHPGKAINPDLVSRSPHDTNSPLTTTPADTTP